jgi:hypothetical protein
VKVTTTTTISDDEQRVSNNEASYVSARHISHCAQAHMLRVKHRRNNQPGNVKHRHAQATSSNIDDLVRKRTGLSSIVRKRTSFQPSCASAQAFSHRAQAHKLSAIVRKRTSFQPSCASARAFNHCAQAQELSAIVRKRMSFQPSCQAHELQRLLWVCINCFCIPRASKKAQGKV